MLNGVAPILIFYFPIIPVTIPLSGIPLLGLSDTALGIPIPIYLDEKLTGIYINTQEKNVDIDTQPETSADGNVKVLQRGVNNTITVHLKANKDSLLLGVLLAFSDEIFKRAVNGRYSVTYLNGPTLVFGGKIQSLSAQEGENDDIMQITMVIHKANQETQTKSTVQPINPTTGGTPLAGEPLTGGSSFA